MGLGPAKELSDTVQTLVISLRTHGRNCDPFRRAPAQEDNWLQSSTILPELPDFISSIPSLNSV